MVRSRCKYTRRYGPPRSLVACVNPLLCYSRRRVGLRESEAAKISARHATSRRTARNGVAAAAVRAFGLLALPRALDNRLALLSAPTTPPASRPALDRGRNALKRPTPCRLLVLNDRGSVTSPRTSRRPVIRNDGPLSKYFETFISLSFCRGNKQFIYETFRDGALVNITFLSFYFTLLTAIVLLVSSALIVGRQPSAVGECARCGTYGEPCRKKKSVADGSRHPKVVISFAKPS